MLKSFGNQLAEDIFHDRKTKLIRRFQPELYRQARRKLFTIHYAQRIEEMMRPPGNRLEKKQGDLKNLWAIRINDQWRIIFRWNGQDAEDVAIVDYH